MGEQKYNYPEDIPDATVADSDFPAGKESIYEEYLKGRIFEALKDVRPWGINTVTMKWLLMDLLAFQEMESGLPAPDPKTVEKILSKYWNMDKVSSLQESDELASLQIVDSDKKPKNFTTHPNGPLNGKRMFVDLGADMQVLRQVAIEAKTIPLPERGKLAYEESLKKYPMLTKVVAEFSIVDVIEERRKETQKLFSVEDTELDTRWSWLTDDAKSSLRSSSVVESMMKKLFSDEQEKTTGLSVVRATAMEEGEEESKDVISEPPVPENIAGRSGMKRVAAATPAAGTPARKTKATPAAKKK